MRLDPVIGIDFDNTMICYEEVFLNNALGSNLMTSKVCKSKKELRDQIRLLPDGDILWQKMQASVYSQGIAQAHAYEGVKDFLRTCAQRGIKIYVVSHKSEFAPFDLTKTSLRQVALDWLAANHFFKADVPVLKKEQVYFESTRLAKIERLRSLGCTHFIDDLEEVFKETTFPKGVEKILFAPQGDCTNLVDMKAFNSWKRIHEHFFN